MRDHQRAHAPSLTSGKKFTEKQNFFLMYIHLYWHDSQPIG